MNELTQFAENLLRERLKQHGITGIEDDVLEEMRNQLVMRAENVINGMILEKMPKHALSAFESVLDRGNETEIQAFIAAQIPNMQECVAETLMRFRMVYLGR